MLDWSKDLNGSGKNQDVGAGVRGNNMSKEQGQENRRRKTGGTSITSGAGKNKAD